MPVRSAGNSQGSCWQEAASLGLTGGDAGSTSLESSSAQALLKRRYSFVAPSNSPSGCNSTLAVRGSCTSPDEVGYSANSSSSPSSLKKWRASAARSSSGSAPPMSSASALRCPSYSSAADHKHYLEAGVLTQQLSLGCLELPERADTAIGPGSSPWRTSMALVPAEHVVRGRSGERIRCPA
jgi:hypothetical protein